MHVLLFAESVSAGISSSEAGSHSDAHPHSGFYFNPSQTLEMNMLDAPRWTLFSTFQVKSPSFNTRQLSIGCG